MICWKTQNGITHKKIFTQLPEKEEKMMRKQNKVLSIENIQKYDKYNSNYLHYHLTVYVLEIPTTVHRQKEKDLTRRCL